MCTWYVSELKLKSMIGSTDKQIESQRCIDYKTQSIAFSPLAIKKTGTDCNSVLVAYDVCGMKNCVIYLIINHIDVCTLEFAPNL